MKYQKIANKIAQDAVQRLSARVASSYIRAFKMTEDEWKRYQHDHPDAEKRNHTIISDPKSDTTDKEFSPQHKPQTEQKPQETANKPKLKVPEFTPKHEVKLNKQQLNNVLAKGHYSIISAGRNPNNPEESKLDPDDETFQVRHKQLQKDLEDLGMKYTEVVGHYGGKESTFMVFHDDEANDNEDRSFMVHHDPKEGKEVVERRQTKLNELGEKYNQDSVLHGNEGKNQIHFTTGKHKGESCGGIGYEEIPDADDLYTDIELEGRSHTKFRTNIDECFEKGYF